MKYSTHFYIRIIFRTLNNFTKQNKCAKIKVTKYKGDLVVKLLDQIIVPNLVIDEYATEIAKKNAQDSVKPYEVVFKKGENIVSEGDQIHRLQKDALREAGYNVLQVNFAGILGVFVLISAFTFIFLRYEKNYENRFYNQKHLTIMASFTLLLAFIAAVFGGIGIIPGAMLGGFFIGIVETMVAGYGSSLWKDAVVYIILILFIQCGA